MATYNTRPTNGVSYGYIHTVTSQDATDNEVILDFQVPFDLVAAVMVTTDDAQGQEYSDPGDMKIDYPDKGQVRIRDGDSSFTLNEGDKIHVIAQRDASGLVYNYGS